jgi:hypothetical protein
MSKLFLKNWICGYGIDLSGSGQGPLTGSYEHGNQILGSIKGRAFRGQVSQLVLCFQSIFQHCSRRAKDTLKWQFSRYSKGVPLEIRVKLDTTLLTYSLNEPHFKLHRTGPESGRNYEVLGLFPAGSWFESLQVVENTATMFVDFLRLSKQVLV